MGKKRVRITRKFCIKLLVMQKLERQMLLLKILIQKQTNNLETDGRRPQQYQAIDMGEID